MEKWVPERRSRRVIVAGLSLAFLQIAAPALADHECSDATRVYVLTDCTGQSDCFEGMHELEDWIWDQNGDHDNRCSAPSASDRLFVDIGPGTFTETGLTVSNPGFECPDGGTTTHGYLTLRGSGKDQTFVVGEGNVTSSTMRFRECTDISVQDLTVINDDGTAIYWLAGGTSQWTNISVRGQVYGWYDGGPSCTATKGIHYWFSSQIEAESKAFKSSCDENWIYGSDVVLKPGATPSAGATAILVFDQGDVRLFGSTVRLDASAIPSTTAADLFGIRVGTGTSAGSSDGDGTVHMHGGIISLNATGLDDVDLTAVQVDRFTSGTGIAHIVDTAYAINDKTTGTPNTGDVKRVEILPASTAISALRSPFLWPAATQPPLQDRLQSADGFDQYVETDCQDDGLCDETSPTETHPHLMIYDESCDQAPGNSPWFDTTTGRCRNDDGS